MTTEKNVATLRRAVQAINDRDLSINPTLVTAGFVRHDLASAFREVGGREGVTDFLQLLIEAVPDLQIREEELIATDDRAALRVTLTGTHQGEFQDIAPTGRGIERDFRWSPSYSGSNWTLLLLPVYVTHYRDDEGVAQRILLNGQTGQLYGVKRGSAARAQRRALTIGAISLVIFALSLMVALLGLLLPPLLIVGILGAVLALLIGAGALIPIGRVALFNRRQRDIPVEV